VCSTWVGVFSTVGAYAENGFGVNTISCSRSIRPAVSPLHGCGCKYTSTSHV